MVQVGIWCWAYALLFVLNQLGVCALEPKDFARSLLNSKKSDIQFEKNKTIGESEALRLLHGQFLPEPDVVLADPALGNITLMFGDSAKYELYKITPRECYLCRFPPKAEVEKVIEKQHGQALSVEDQHEILTDAIKALKKLRGTCLSYFQGYFAYEFCYNFQIRQLPISKHLQLKAQSSVMSDAADPAHNIYILGKWKQQLESTSKSRTSLEHHRDRSTLSANTLPSNLDQEVQILSTDQHLVLEQIWSDGTICDLNGVPRTTVVKPKTTIYPIQCRLVTPDDQEVRKSYLKEINFHRVKPHSEQDNALVYQLENGKLDEPLEFDMSNALESDQESVLVDRLNALDQDDKVNSAIQDIIGHIQSRAKSQEYTASEDLEPVDNKAQATSHTETERMASVDDTDRIIQVLLNAIKKSSSPTYEAQTDSQSTSFISHTTKNNPTSTPNHDEL
ncbi:Protein OS-9 [Malassezia yamatoensis]|uniref:Protein OS-9 homolog n=1 Tax=Malassezia yamatoensis TaxID=253288 RepID=A0AAJ5YSI5_9BASI|nr:Protein OS-9 [Malassezia yamatoensis]